LTHPPQKYIFKKTFLQYSTRRESKKELLSIISSSEREKRLSIEAAKPDSRDVTHDSFGVAEKLLLPENFI
jgi:hypothetical protein